MKGRDCWHGLLTEDLKENCFQRGRVCAEDLSPDTQALKPLTPLEQRHWGRDGSCFCFIEVKIQKHGL